MQTGTHIECGRTMKFRLLNSYLTVAAISN